jgi:predicted nucleotidyltransferase
MAGKGPMVAVVDEIRSYFETRHEVAAVYLFGSYGRGEPRASSDVDVAVVFAEGCARDAVACGFYRAEYVADLEDRLQRRVDVIDLERVDPVLAFSVLTEGRVILERDVDRRVAAEVRQAALYQDLSERRRAYIQRLLEGRP